MVLKVFPDAMRDGKPARLYSTSKGSAYLSTIEDFLKSSAGRRLRGKVDLIMTSPPFPLVAPKRYGNLKSEEYIEWMESLAGPLADLLSPTGSLVLEIGNAWNQGSPTMSTVPLETLVRFAAAGDLNICQQFVCHNSARLPSPAPWVTVRRIRAKDSFTHVWWYSRTEFPKADNRQVLQDYSPAMRRLIKRGSYNAGLRPSDHEISETGFLTDHGGSIPSSALTFANTASPKEYREWCTRNGLRAHPARMQAGLVDFFVRFLTTEGDLVFDPFGGSNTTGSVAESLQRRWAITEPDSDYLVGSMGRFGADRALDRFPRPRRSKSG